MVNESAGLFETRSEPRRPMVGDDLVAVLGSRLERLIERHRATQRAVSELREAIAARERRIAELDARLASGERARDELVARVDALLADVDRLIEAADGDSAPHAR
ncbi:MAG: hypothetical protein ACHQ6T_17320 [Myxococcota bacterium]